MKNLKNNKKGFTLIELLAVIVILAILVMVAIPAVTKYLNTSRNSAFLDNAKSAVSAVRNDYIISGGSGTACTIDGADGVCYNKAKINSLLEKKLVESPFGGDYRDACVQVIDTNSGANLTDVSDVTYKICLIDNNGKGFEMTEENAIKMSSTIIATGVTCGCPA